MLKGIGSSEGYGIGKVLIVKEQSLYFVPRSDCDPERELERYKKAVDEFCNKTKQVAEHLKEAVGEQEAGIINSHIVMIKDPYMNEEIEKLIQAGHCAESALASVCHKFSNMFSSAKDELTKQRAVDVHDIKNTVLSILLGAEETDISSAPENTILVAKDLTPSMTACINKDNISGIITETGGRTSHSAIIARAMEIPAVLSVENITGILSNGDTVIVNGSDGVIIQSPNEEQIEEYAKKRVDFIEERKALYEFVGRETTTADGIKLELLGNIRNTHDAVNVIECDGEGIGLFRTEFLFMGRSSAPDEEEQFEEYKRAAIIMKNKPVIIRTLDVGGDKAIPYLKIKKEDNYFLGCRGVRYCLKNKSMYKKQLRAIIRASAFGDVRILLPLVTSVDEVRQVRKMIQKIMDELSQKGVAYNKNLKVGVMMETSAACLVADLLAKEADFFSIGTNDLTQYIMCADRGNADVAYLCSTYNPAVIRSIKYIIECGKNAGIPVGMCGEAASDKYMIPLLISFGLDEFSVNGSSVLYTRKVISQWTKSQADEVAKLVSEADTEQEIVRILKENANKT
ncbi:MAG: phosphoenolpyruvate--protein phosphotransferase [Ruminococcus sp.]|nr:phosphoenolpyruvate--protein phosphotransferase [Ruminococcus sp.]